MIAINLGRTLFFDVLFCQKGLPDEQTRLLRSINDNEALLSINFCEAENYNLLVGQPIDLFINIASMQEMDPPVVNNYFNYMRLSNSENVYFYCCNRIEKILPDGTVTKFFEYPCHGALINLEVQ